MPVEHIQPVLITWQTLSSMWSL